MTRPPRCCCQSLVLPCCWHRTVTGYSVCAANHYCFQDLEKLIARFSRLRQNRSGQAATLDPGRQKRMRLSVSHSHLFSLATAHKRPPRAQPGLSYNGLVLQFPFKWKCPIFGTWMPQKNTFHPPRYSQYQGVPCVPARPPLPFSPSFESRTMKRIGTTCVLFAYLCDTLCSYSHIIQLLVVRIQFN